MILTGIIELLVIIIELLFYPFNLPDMPDLVVEYIELMKQYIMDGAGLLWVFFDKQVVTVCLTLVLAIMVFEKGYYFTMWLLRKTKLE